MVALLEACDVTNNGRHLGRHLGCYQELEIRLEPREIQLFEGGTKKKGKFYNIDIYPRSNLVCPFHRNEAHSLW